jgi:hypothetical protein
MMRSTKSKKVSVLHYSIDIYIWGLKQPLSRLNALVNLAIICNISTIKYDILLIRTKKNSTRMKKSPLILI